MNLRGYEVNITKKYEVKDDRKYSYRIFGNDNIPVLIVGNSYDKEEIDGYISHITTPYDKMGYVFSNIVIPTLTQNKYIELTEDEINEIVSAL